MEDIVIIGIQVIIELIIQSFGSPGISYAGGSQSDRGCLVVLLHMFLGAMFGWVSCLVSPKLLLPTFGFQMVNIVVMTLLATAVGYGFAKAMNRRGYHWEPEIHALQGGLFAFPV
jgi:hypothetical protein